MKFVLDGIKYETVSSGLKPSGFPIGALALSYPIYISGVVLCLKSTSLEAIEKIEDRDDNVLSQFFVNNNLKLTKYQQLEVKYASKKKFLSDILKRSVAISTGKKEIDIQYLQPLSDFISLYKPLHIFSTNYDICVERFCVINSKKYFDGFAHE